MSFLGGGRKAEGLRLKAEEKAKGKRLKAKGKRLKAKGERLKAKGKGLKAGEIKMVRVRKGLCIYI